MERWKTRPALAPGAAGRVDVVGEIPGHPSVRVVALSVLPIDAEIMVAQQAGLAAKVQALRVALEWAVTSGDHQKNCPAQRRPGEMDCDCWMRHARAALKSATL